MEQYTDLAERARQLSENQNVVHSREQSNINTFRGYNMIVSIYNQSAQIEVVDDCFAFMFTNVGDSIAFINGMVIFPSATPTTAIGDSRSIGGHLMDLYKGKITLAFDANLLGAAPAVEIVQLFYVNPYRKFQRISQ